MYDFTIPVHDPNEITYDLDRLAVYPVKVLPNGTSIEHPEIAAINLDLILASFEHALSPKITDDHTFDPELKARDIDALRHVRSIVREMYAPLEII